jgi:hypothetical protein
LLFNIQVSPDVVHVIVNPATDVSVEYTYTPPAIVTVTSVLPATYPVRFEKQTA